MRFKKLGIEPSGDVTLEIVEHVQDALECQFPKSYVELVMYNDEAIPEVGMFSYAEGTTGISEFLKFSDDINTEFGILSYRADISGIPSNLIPIARDAGDYLVCFDREKEYAVVLLDRDEDIVYEIAATFDTFIESLRE